MSERPILFNAPMVRALLDGSKTQTRRIMKPQPPEDCGQIVCERFHPTIIVRGEEAPGAETFGASTCDGEWAVRCPYGQPGDRLWVRETWRDAGNSWHYAADGTMLPKLSDRELQAMLAARVPLTWESYTWKPSIHMPRRASRITLEITGVRVERLQDISVADAMAEGVIESAPYLRGLEPCMEWRYAYEDLWRSINGSGPGSWDANPWVWVIAFRRAQP